jgi:multicomponent Na+:H+ antiporter subunit D
MLYGITGHLLFPGLKENLGILAASSEYTMPLFVLTGLMVTGLAIKSALFPFHGWLPDAHASATTAASAVLSGLIIKCYPVLLIKLIYNVYSPEILTLLRIPHLMIIFGVMGVLYGSWMATRQKDIKRMLSYASISNIGYIFAAIGINTKAGIAAACFHIVVHATGKAMLFTAAGGLSAVSGYKKDYTSMQGAARRDPLSGAAFIAGCLSMIGLPLFPGFASKLWLTSAVMETPFAALIVPTLVVAATILAALYYIPVMSCIFSKGGPDTQPYTGFRHLFFLNRTALFAFLALTLFLGIFPQSVMRIIEQALSVLAR